MTGVAGVSRRHTGQLIYNVTLRKGKLLLI